MVSNKLEKLLYDNCVYDAMQFIYSSYSSLIDAVYYKNMILNISKSILEENDQWRNTIEPCDEQGQYAKVDTTTVPRFWTSIFDVKISKMQLRDMMIKSFFQSCRNALDAMAQAANAACLANNALPADTTDFNCLKKLLQKKYSQDFPYMLAWFVKTENSDDYQYINAYCNRTKHTHYVKSNLSLPLRGDDIIDSIEPFYKLHRNHLEQLDKREITDYIPKAYSFISSCFDEFIVAIEQEVPKKKYIDNRVFDVRIFQEYLKESPDNGYSMAFFETGSSIESMPDQIQVLIVAESKVFGVIPEYYGTNCTFNTLYVKDTTNNTYIGKYIAEEQIGKDSLLRFRKYKKTEPKDGDKPLIEQAKTDTTQVGKFYRMNPFVKVFTSSDDDNFLRKFVFFDHT